MDTQCNTLRSRLAFTMVELLVVITIIGILAGFTFPAVTGAITQAKKTQAAGMVVNLKTALNSYQTEYGGWPTILQNGTNDAGQLASYGDANSLALYNILIGNKNDATTLTAGYNPKLIAFMEFNSKDIVFDSALTPKGFKDPFGNPYYILVDGNFDNQITVPFDRTQTTSNNTATVVNTNIAIWSYGNEAYPSTGTTAGALKPSANPSKYVTSW